MDISELNTQYNKLTQDLKELKVLKNDQVKIIKNLKHISKDLADIDEEKSFWKNEIESIRNNPKMEDELSMWEETLKTLQDSKKEKLKDFNKLEISKDEINDRITVLKKGSDLEELKNSILDILRTKTSLLSEKDTYEIIKILKNILEISEDKKKDLFSFLDYLYKNQIATDIKIFKISTELYENNLSVLPEQITSFINSLINKKEKITILDTNPLEGFMIISLLNAGENFQISIPEKSKEFIEKILPSQKFLKMNFCKLENIENLDVVIGYFSPKNSEISDLNLDNNLLSDFEYSLELLKSAQKIKPDGQGFFIINSKFLLKRDDVSVLSNLNKFNLYLNAVFDLSDFNEPYSENILIIITRNPSKKIFIGSINKKIKNNQIILENFSTMTEGKLPQYGSLTNLDNFYSFKLYLKQQENKILFENRNLETTIFSEIIKEFNFYPLINEFKDSPNSIYLPLFNTEDVLLSLEQAKESNENYSQIILKSKSVFDNYITDFLNNSIGKKIRDPLSLGESNEILFEHILKNIQIYVPNIEEQLNIVSLDSFIRDISTRASNFHEELWRNPESYSKIQEILKPEENEQEYNFEKWVESLPFPLSSILWESIVVSDFEYKVKYLLHFFEAFSEFNIIILLSCLISDHYFFEKEFSRSIENNKQKFWFFSPTFGNWNYFGNFLSKNIQRMSRNQFSQNKILELFGNAEPEFIKKITSNELYDVLYQVSKYRNSWDAHGPVVNSEEHENRYKILKASLSKFYEIIGHIYSNSFLILPQSNNYKDGIYYYTVKKFVGTNTKLKELEIETSIPLDTDKIYFYSQEQRIPVEILPLIKFQEKTCYFYNHRNKEKYQSRYISYHNKENPVKLYPLSEIDSFISIFERKNQFNY